MRKISCGILLAMVAAGMGVGLTNSAPAHAYQVVQRIPVEGNGFWDYLTEDPATQRLYISRGTHVDVLNLRTGKLAGQIANTPGVHGVALAPKLNHGFTSNGGDGTVTMFNMKTLRPIKVINVGQGPDSIVYDPASNRVFTLNGRSPDSTAIDADTGKVAGTVPLDGRPEAAVADGKGSVYVNIESKSEMLRFNSRTLKVLNTWSVSPGDGPSGLAMDTAHRRLFSVCHNGMMVVMNADTGKVIATPAIGQGPDAAEFDPGKGLAFSSNGQDGTLTIVKEATPDHFSVLQTVPTQKGARTMALDIRTHRVYLVTAREAPTPAADAAPAATGGAASPGRPGGPGGPRWRRRSYAPGSFVVLVVAP